MNVWMWKDERWKLRINMETRNPREGGGNRGGMCAVSIQICEHHLTLSKMVSGLLQPVERGLLMQINSRTFQVKNEPSVMAR